jgi:hypothetical protein
MRLTQIVSTVAIAGAMTFAGASVARAQDPINLGVGYQFTHFSGDGFSDNAPAGFFVDVTGKLPNKSGMIAWNWLGEVSGAYKSETGATFHNYTFGGGVRGSWDMNPQAMPFVQVEVGGVNQGGGGDSSNAFMVDLGGGVKIPMMGKKFSIVGKVDYVRAFFSDANGGGENIVRVGGGVVFPINAK